MTKHSQRLASLVLTGILFAAVGRAEPLALDKLTSPLLFQGDATTAYRDPAAIYSDGWFRLFFTLVKVESDKQACLYTAWSKSRDLRDWTPPTIFTPRDQRLNYSSPGNIVRQGDEWVLCLQSYPRPDGEKFGNADARIFTLRSRDLEHWSEPELLRVKGPDVPREEMGRMIDPFLLADKDDPSKWWCFYKQDGMGSSLSRDLKTWTYAGRVHAGENPCVIRDGDQYVLFHAPRNGIGMKRSHDLKQWDDAGTLTLGQRSWPWAAGRLTAGFVLDLRQDPGVGKALMFFHGSELPEGDRRGGFDNFASIGIAWSADLKNWAWPGDSPIPSPAATKPAVDGARVPTHAGVRYGSDSPRQSLDFWQAQSDKATPVVIYFHGGAWERGSRSEVKIRGLTEYLNAGISVASVDYRFISDAKEAGMKPPVRWPLQDAARAVQFVRSKAAEWGIDKSRVAFSGLSAGACTSLWLALHDDLANPKSNDPIARESTRAVCVGVVDAQTSLDLHEIHQWFNKTPTYGAHAFGLGRQMDETPEAAFARFEAAREQLLPWIKEYSPIEHASADGPPICLYYQHKPPGDTIHGATFGLKLKEKLDSLGVECEVICKDSAHKTDENQINFIIHKLKAATPSR